ncbi:hypothetical protein [Brevibacillus laterosporus]|uniref:hypothetical protein n=1 Tax=Brevibacillus laterosporus TaxID=1465 RepID=UPI000B9B785C|nr:hypothetical protein [Brevibacillus laterosporus]
MNISYYIQKKYDEDTCKLVPSKVQHERQKQISQMLSDKMNANQHFLEKHNLQRVNFDADINDDGSVVITKIYLVHNSCDVTTLRTKHKFTPTGNTVTVNDNKGEMISMLTSKKTGAIILLIIGLSILGLTLEGMFFSPLGGTLLVLLSLFFSYILWKENKEDESKV